MDPQVLVPENANHVPTKLHYSIGSENGNIVVDCFGHASNPPVLFFHGGGQTRFAWTQTAIKFAENGFCALSVDMKGHGESYWDKSQQPRKYGVESFAKDIDSIVAHLKLPKRANGYALVGASLGGLSILASQFAKDHASGLVLVDITPRMELVGVHRVVNWMKSTQDGFANLQEAADAIASYNPDRSRSFQDDASLQGLKKNLRQNENGRWVWHWDPDFLDKKETTASDLVEYERRLFEHAENTTTRCLLVRGRQTDLVSEDGAKSFVSRMPNARYVDVTGSHMVVGDNNDAFSKETLLFMSEIFGKNQR